MSFRAKFPSRCALCNVRIQVDDEIEIVEALGERKPAHEQCAWERSESDGSDEESAGAAICKRCNLQHRGECW